MIFSSTVRWDARSKSTSSRARVAPKFLDIRSMRRSGGRLSSISSDVRIFGKIRQKKRPDLGIVYVVTGGDVDSRIDDLLDRLAAKVERHQLDAQVAHLDRVLEDESLDVPVPERLDELRRAVKPDEDDLPRETGFLEGPQRPERARLVRAENTVHVGEPADEVLGQLVGAFRRRSRVLILDEKADGRGLGLHGLQKALLSLGRAGRAGRGRAHPAAPGRCRRLRG